MDYPVTCTQVNDKTDNSKQEEIILWNTSANKVAKSIYKWVVSLLFTRKGWQYKDNSWVNFVLAPCQSHQNAYVALES